MSPATVARRQAPPRYRATRSAAADRVRSRSLVPPCAGSYHTTESTSASSGCRTRTARPKVLSRAANWRVPWRSCRRTSCTLSAQNPQVPSYSRTGLGDSTWSPLPEGSVCGAAGRLAHRLQAVMVPPAPNRRFHCLATKIFAPERSRGPPCRLHERVRQLPARILAVVCRSD
jgi:hypothetical protein